MWLCDNIKKSRAKNIQSTLILNPNDVHWYINKNSTTTPDIFPSALVALSFQTLEDITIYSR